VSIARGLLKGLALIGGAFVTVVCLMSVVGMWTDNGWARAGGAIAVALGAPLLAIDLILAKIRPEKQNGVTTDLLAVTYLGFAVVFVGAAHAYSQPLLADEAHRLDDAGMTNMARTAYLLAGSKRAEAAPAPSVATPTPTPKEPAKPSTDTKAPELRAGDGKERTPAQIFSEFAPSVVTILVKGHMGEGGGTGFVIDGAGTVATNFHVIDHASEIKVKLMDGTIADDVEVLAENQPDDLALLRIKTAKTPGPLVLGDSEKVTVGERAVSIGNPLGLEHTLTDGLISARRVIEGRKMIQMSTPVSPGNSGGPLFNSRGEVIGVSAAIFHGGSPLAQNLNLAVPIDDLRAMIRTDYPGRHKVGDGFGVNAGRW
jgi:serine protease Do